MVALVTPLSASGLSSDSNGNVTADGFIPGFTSTATSAGTLTLTVDSAQFQVLTGSSAHTVQLPTTGVAAGQTFVIMNAGTGVVAINASNTVLVCNAQAGAYVFVTANQATPTTPSHWQSGHTSSALPRSSANAFTAAVRDGQANLLADNFVSTGVSIVTAASVTAMSVDSPGVIIFTGSTTQTCTLPTTSITLGMSFTIINKSTGTVTVNSSGGNLVKSLTTGLSTIVTAIQATPTTAAHWNAT